ncbi:MAG TPA: hypothetical protein VKB76_07085 [Ktedonobacterales bacterium]|nr:hypothetical protein [Ktedonobacterales bacterium]
MDNAPTSLCGAVQEATERLKAWFEMTPWDQGSTSLESINHMTVALAAGFTAYFAPADVAERFVIPTDYLCFLQANNGWREPGDGYGLYMHGTSLVISNTQYLCDVMAEMRPATAGMWIEIGHYLDKHDLFLCCDRQLPYIGMVVDGHDDHPWIPDGYINSWVMEGNPTPYSSFFYASFLQYLHSIER